MKLAVIGALALSFAVPSFARPLTVDEKIKDFSQLVSQMESNYGPLLYKKEKQGIAVQDVSNKYIELIKNTPDNGSYYYLLNQYVGEFNDGHFGGSVATTRSAKAGIMTELVQGKVLIASVDRAVLPKEAFAFDRGDEVVEVDGRPVIELVKELQTYIGSGYDLTEKAIASWLVFNRPGTKVPVPTAATVKAKFRRGTSDIVEDVELKWVITGEGLDEFLPPNPTPDPTPKWFNTKAPVDYDRLSTREIMKSYLGENIDRTYMCNPGTRVAMPEGATVIMATPFVAYYHPTAKGNIGYLRIPDYMPMNAKGEQDFEGRFRQYEYAIRQLEANTVGLVIDQDHNCGGSVTYLHNVLSLFMSQDFLPMQFELRASKSEYLSFKAWVDELPPFTVSKEEVKGVADLIKAEWEKGSFLTPKTSITGEKSLAPNRIRYTKPILMLIDFMAGSGGDAFPALMQGYGRAKLLGTRTSGLGGHVQEMPPLTYSAFTYRMTRSLFYRPDGTPVENNGAAPDFDYEISRDDFMYEYKPYQRFYLEKMLSMLP